MPALNSLRQGQSGRIREITGEDAVAVRLMEMGLTEGEPITLLGYAPLGDPIEFLVRGYRVSLRSTEAQRVMIDSL
ncbi:MAG: FeoA family protein [Planctomycetaceae bacterium]